MSKKLLVIGLDGASFGVLDALIERGDVPNLARLIATGARAPLETTFPPITAVAWSSFMTGRNPGKHGIFEFVRLDKGTKRELAVNASFREGPAIWDVLSDANRRVIVHNFPCTYPPHSVNGLMIADFMTPRGRRDFTYPDSLLQEIEAKFGPYRLHLSQTYGGGGAQGVLAELDDELEYKSRVAEYLMTQYEWDAFFQYFWGTDRIQHELWHIFDENHPRHDSKEASRHREGFFAYFRRVDQVIGRLLDLAGPECVVWVASDHGFGPAHKYCSFNIWLLQEGFLQLKRDAKTRLKKAMFRFGITPENAFKLIKRLPLGRLRPSRGASNEAGTSRFLSTFFLSFNDVDWSRTLAFSKGNYGQIYVNLRGREPEGAVEPADYDAICARIIDRLKALRDPQSDEPWVDEVFRREEIYDGPHVTDAPDIAFLPRDMRYLPLGNADFTSNRFIVDAFGISGCHRMDGVMIANAPMVKPGSRLERARIYDVAPTLLYLMDAPVPPDTDGRLLSEIIADQYLREHPFVCGAPPVDAQRREVEFSDDENAEVIESLRNLGYIG